MKEKNGFIATSVLYAFLLCFLTLFLAYMANYIQNQMLLDKVRELAKEDLKKYGNTYVTDMSIGDYVIFDTIDPEGDASNSGTKVYDSPINPDARWILFKIDEGELIDKDKKQYEDSRYYFVSDKTAQKYQPLVNSLGRMDGGNFLEVNDDDNLEPVVYEPSLKNIHRVMNGNIYYSSKKYWSSLHPDSTAKTAYRYGFPYSVGGGINEIRYMTDEDLSEIFALDENIIEAIMDQEGDTVLWNTGSYFSDPRKGIYDDTRVGFFIYTFDQFEPVTGSIKSGYDPNIVNSVCQSTGATAKDYLVEFNNNEGNDMSYGHIYTTVEGRSYVDYCYHMTTYLGDCSTSMDYACKATNGKYPVRYVIELVVNKGNLVMNGRVDSGNGTSRLPYLITTGA